jgi:hypothetical protein
MSAPSALRSYFQAVYRDPLAASWPNALLQRRVDRLEWLYHGAGAHQRLTCAHPYGRARASFCGTAHNRSRHGLVFCTPIKVRNMNWFGFWRPPNARERCAKAAFPKPKWTADGSWTEVIRIATRAVTGGAGAIRRFGEGGGHGCWFLAAKGSGVFLHVGRSIRAHNRSELTHRLGLNVTALGGWGNPWVEMHPNVRFCDAARSVGYDTIQLLDEGCGNALMATASIKLASTNGQQVLHACYVEIVSCHPGCMALQTKSHFHACVDVPLRTGWDATRPCLCNNSATLLNCMGTEAAIPPATEALMAGLPTKLGSDRFPPQAQRYSAVVSEACRPSSHSSHCTAMKAHRNPDSDQHPTTHVGLESPSKHQERAHHAHVHGLPRSHAARRPTTTPHSTRLDRKSMHGLPDPFQSRNRQKGESTTV